MGDDVDIEVMVAADPVLLASVRSMMRTYFESTGYSSERVDELVLGVDEACANALRHGCKGDAGRRYTIRLSRTTEWLRIELRDSGRKIPKGPEDCPDEEPPSIDTIEPGGLGLPLIQRIFDEVEFGRRMFAGNSLILKVKRPSGEPQAGTG